MRIECPGCGAAGSVDLSFTGRKVRCPKCGEVFRCSTQAESAVEGPREDGAEPGRDAPDLNTERQGRHDDEDETEAPLLDIASTGESPVPGPNVFDREPPTAGTEIKAGQNPFVVGDMLRRSWERTRGAKGQIWLGILVMLVILGLVEGGALTVGRLFGLDITGTVEGETVSPGSTMYDFLSSWLSTILTAGIMLMGVTWVRDGRVRWQDVFSGFPRALSILIAMVLQFVLLVAGYALFILPGIYLTVGYSLVLPLIVDRGMGPWQALEESRKAVHKVWWQMFGLLVVMMLIISLSALPFGIGLIWTVPMGVVLSGLIYVQLFPGADNG